jgi:acetyl esterase/lipase
LVLRERESKRRRNKTEWQKFKSLLRPKQFLPALRNLIAAVDWHSVLGNAILYISGGFVAFLSRYSHNPFLPLYVVAWYASELPQVILLLQTVSVAAAFKLTGGFHDYISQLGVLWHAGSAAYSIAHVMAQAKAAPAFKRMLLNAGMGQPRATPRWIRALFWCFPLAATMKLYGNLRVDADIQYTDGANEDKWWGSRDATIPEDPTDTDQPTGARFRWYPEGNRPAWMSSFRGITHLIRGFGSKGWRHLDIIYQKDGSSSNANGQGGGKPVMLYIHGGGWATCDKWMSMLPVIYRVASEGVIVVSANYRLAPEYKFPTMLHDAKRALVWTKKHIAEYGGDPNCIVVAGESAGGHIAALCALSQNDRSRQPGFESEDTSVQGCIDMYGYHDFTDRAEYSHELYHPRPPPGFKSPHMQVGGVGVACDCVLCVWVSLVRWVGAGAHVLLLLSCVATVMCCY